VPRLVVVDDLQVVDRDVGGALIPRRHRVAACGHGVADELVSTSHACGGVIDEARLDDAPALDVVLALRLTQRSCSACLRPQDAAAAFSTNCVVVLWPELPLQLAGVLLLVSGVQDVSDDWLVIRVIFIILVLLGVVTVATR
jgi:hypothetical protein